MEQQRKTVTGHAKQAEAIRQIKRNPREYFAAQDRPDRLSRRSLPR